jgi:predicted enzyme related to lactoylglutathione lyase
MFKPTGAFSGFSVDDLARAKTFYADTLGLDVEEEGDMGLNLRLPGGGNVFVYPKDDHVPATFTVLNLIVDDIDAAIDALEARGVAFDRYDLGGGAVSDDKGVLRGLAAGRGPDIAWFKDPAGNVVSVLQTD